MREQVSISGGFLAGSPSGAGWCAGVPVAFRDLAVAFSLVATISAEALQLVQRGSG